MPSISREQLTLEAEQDRLRSAYLLLGQDEYLKRQIEQLLRRTVLTGGMGGFNSTDASARGSLHDALNSAHTLPFGARRRLVVLRDLEQLGAKSREDDAGLLLAYLERPSTRTVLLLTASEVDRRTTFYRKLSDVCALVDCGPMKDREAEQFVSHLAKSLGCGITPPAAAKLVAFLGTDSGLLAGEVEKIVLSGDAGRTIQDSEMEGLIRESRQHKIFELTDAMGRRDRSAALRLLARLLEDEESPIGVVAMLARHFRQLIIAKEMTAQGRNAGSIAQGAQIPPFKISEFLAQAKAFEWHSLRQIYIRLAALDLRLKSSSTDPQMLLENLICSL